MRASWTLVPASPEVGPEAAVAVGPTAAFRAGVAAGSRVQEGGRMLVEGDRAREARRPDRG